MYAILTTIIRVQFVQMTGCDAMQFEDHLYCMIWPKLVRSLLIGAEMFMMLKHIPMLDDKQGGQEGV
jgi:hypothetical protein